MVKLCEGTYETWSYYDEREWVLWGTNLQKIRLQQFQQFWWRISSCVSSFQISVSLADMNIRGPSVCWCGPTTMARWPKSTLLLTVRPRASCAFLAQQAIAGSAAMMFGVSWSSVLIWLETNPTEGKTLLGHARTSAGAETGEVIGTHSEAAGRKTSCH